MKMHELTDHEANLLACAAIHNLLHSMAPVARTDEGKALIGMLNRAVRDGSQNAATLALGLVIAGAAAWEAHQRAAGQPSVAQRYDHVRANIRKGVN